MSGTFLNVLQQGSTGEGRDNPNTKMSVANLNENHHGLISMGRCEFKLSSNALAPD